MATRYVGLAPISIPAEDERYATEADAQIRCDALTAEIDDAREARILAGDMLTSWNYVRYVPDMTLSGDWRPKLSR